MCVCAWNVDPRKTYCSYNFSTSWNKIKRINFCLHFSLLFVVDVVFVVVGSFNALPQHFFFLLFAFFLASFVVPYGVHIFVYSHSEHNTFSDNNGDDVENVERKNEKKKK